jgi:hypothetical protein
MRHYFCSICDNSWMSHLPVERDHELCQVCDHCLYGVGGNIELTPGLEKYLNSHGYRPLVHKLKPLGRTQEEKMRCKFCGNPMDFQDFGPWYPLYQVPGASVGYFWCSNYNDENHGDPRIRADRKLAYAKDRPTGCSQSTQTSSEIC